MGKVPDSDAEAETQTLGVAATVGAAEAETATAAGATAEARPSAPVVRPGVKSPLQRGDRLEQFLILERLGSGGMGVVVAAHDPDLDRKVAIKVLRTDVSEGGSEAAGRIRLLREAQAMAKLSHPNVITVHEVGVVDDQVFVAMEYVDGPTLGKWVRQEKPGWPETLTKYIDAARGLAAAHEAGLVHRDFKPANVLVGSDGRVRVTDFGLVGTTTGAEAAAGDESGREDSGEPPLTDSDASSAHDSAPPQTPQPSGPPSSGALGMALTTAGQVMGTPVYMAPEQHLGQRVDARADQFAFCVSLYEALYGKRPFSVGKGREDLAANVCRGKIKDPPKDSDVPAWIRRVLVRGLSVDPDDRYADMGAVIEALQKDPAIARRRAGMLAGIALLAGVAIFGLIRGFGADHPPLCKGAGEKLEGVWDGSVKKAVLAAFTGTNLPHAADTFDRASRALDDYTDAWVAMRTEACEATHVRGEQSEALLDARMNCLDRRLGEVRALTDLFAREPDKDVVNSAVRATLELTPLDACADRKALMAAVPPLEDPALREKVDGVRARLDEANANQKAGKYEAGLAIAEGVRNDAQRIGYKPLLASALFSLGSLETDANKREMAEQTLRAAATAAADAGDRETVAKAWILLVFVVGYLEARHSDALLIGELADTAVRLAGSPPDLRGMLDLRLASVQKEEGNYRKARELNEKALQDLEEAHGGDDPRVATCLSNQAKLLSQLGESDAAEKSYRRALRIRETSLGPNHPDVADALVGLASLLSQSRPQEAREFAERAIAIRKATLPPDHPMLASALNILGTVQLAEGKYEQARETFTESHAIWAKALGADHPNVAQPLFFLGYSLRALNRPEDAKREYERALAILENALGPDHPKLANSIRELGDLALEQKHWERAASLCERALSLDEKAFGEDYPMVAYELSCLGQALVGKRETSRAVGVLERALALSKKLSLDPVNLAVLQFSLARSLWLLGRDHTRAVDLAQKAHAGLATRGDDPAVRELAESVDRWLVGKQDR